MHSLARRHRPLLLAHCRPAVQTTVLLPSLHRGLRSSSTNEPVKQKPRSITLQQQQQDEHKPAPPPPQQDDFDPFQPPQSKTAKFLSRFGPLGAGLVLLGTKGKVFLFGALKFGKLGSLASIFASTAAYSFIFGLPFGAGIVGLFMVHEYGHILQLKRLGVPFKPMFLVPFFGAFVSHGQTLNAYDSAKVALAGPAVGGAASLAVAVAGHAADSQFLIALGDFGLYLNLINLFPLGALDGGVITGALSKWFLVGGLGVGGGLMLTGAITSPIFGLALIMGAFSTYSRFTGGGGGDYHDEDYYEIPRKDKIFIGTSYAALVVGLAVAHSVNARHKKSPAQLRLEAELRLQRELQQEGGAAWEAAPPLPHAQGQFEKAVFEWSRDPAEDELRSQDLWFQQQQQQERGR